MSYKDSVKYKLIAKKDDYNDSNNVLNDDEDDEADQNEIQTFSIEENDAHHVKKNKKPDKCSSFRNLFFILFFIITILLTLVIIFSAQLRVENLKDYIFDKFKAPRQSVSNSDWTIKIEDYVTESCIRLFDIDGDGLDDFMFGASSYKDLTNLFNESTNNWNGIEYCGKTELSKDCKGYIYGMRGYDGKLLWKVSTKSEVFAINCHYIDINLDGKPDCIGAGRRRTFLAFDPRNGTVFWESHCSYLNNNWNIYTPVILPIDLDHDGVNDIIISHGGNPAVPSNVKKRDSGRMILYSGKNGTVMGECLLMPDEKESYMSPILHVFNDGSVYLLFGSGGETVPGSLYMISLPSFYNYAMEDYLYMPEKNIDFKGSYGLDKILKSKFKENLFIKGLYSLYDSKSKGVMVPPVMVDINKDGIQDILMSAFDGTLTMYDGATLDVIWKRDYACHETYTSPAPGYFNDDDVPDFMIAQNYGAFDVYRYSIFNILDGRDGSILWEQRSSRMQMISPLTIQTTQKSPPRDIYFYRIQGVQANKFNVSQQVFHGFKPQQPIDKPKKPKNYKKNINSNKRSPFEISVKREEKCPEFETELDGHHEFYKPDCKSDKLNAVFLDTYGLLIDRSIEETPLVVFKNGAEIFSYNYTLEDVKLAENFDESNFDGNDYGSVCVVIEPMERNTGAIGDFDGDGVLDIITIIAKDGLVRNIDNILLKVIVNMEISKISLSTVFNRSEILENSKETIKVNVKSKTDKSNFKNLKFAKKQTWNSYMGYYGNGAFN